MAGEITLDWSNVKELHTSNEYAVIPKDAKLKRGHGHEEIPQGKLSVENQKIVVTTKDSSFVVDETTFNKTRLRGSGRIRSNSHSQQALLTRCGKSGFDGLLDWQGQALPRNSARSIEAGPGPKERIANEETAQSSASSYLFTCHHKP
jgi:hypothetical protein